VLAPGQQIRLTAIAVLGRGELHAKWSPVATAFYRLRPLVRLKRPVKGKEAVALKEVCPLGVFDIEDGGKSVVIAEGRACTMCRECVRHHPELVELSRVKNHFIFCVESTGAYLAKDIVKAALEDFRQTLRGVLLAIEKRREAALQ
jgi:DNA-directed RNA polymerase I and III subunit RPAC1